MSAMAARARGWIGTPYRHQASLKGVGTDCLGLIRGLWRETYGREAETPEPYTPDWAEASGEERLLAAAERWLVRRPTPEMRPGDVLLFRMEPGAPVKHCAVLSEIGPDGGGWSTPIGAGVVEGWMGDWWRRRLAAVFAWPEAEVEVE